MNSKSINPSIINEVLAGGGEMGALMRAFDWSTTAIGSVESWPQSLRTALSILLSSRHPMFIWWGPELVQFYNDGYRPSLGVHKHPQALGQAGKACWEEIWPIIGPQIDGVMNGGVGTWNVDQLVPFARNGFMEEIYFTYGYSPIRDESGKVGGTLVVCTETTQRVISERRMQTLRDLATQLGEMLSVSEACKKSIETLALNPADVPFALLYLLSPDSDAISLVGSTGLPSTYPSSLHRTPITKEIESLWSLNSALQSGQPLLISDISKRFEGAFQFQVGLYPEPVHSALVIPIQRPGQQQPYGALIAGLSPRLIFDTTYEGFLKLVAGQIASAIANAYTHEEERRRAESLAELDRAKTTFFSNISHEFRTPLTLMLGPMEDALIHGDLSLSGDALQMTYRNALRLLRLVNTLLDFSRIEAGRIQASYEPTDLELFTRELASIFRSAVEKAGLEFIVECYPLSEAIYIDKDMWEKIVLNLLSNALKFTFAGTIRVTLVEMSGFIQLAVCDTGAGIPTDELPHLFERFHRVENARSRTHEGTGIGLALVRELVTLHGGTIEVRSKVDKGSCFTVTIPLGKGHLPPDRIGTVSNPASAITHRTAYVEEAMHWSDIPQESVASIAISSSDNAAKQQAARILVVDDNVDMIDYLKRLLGQHYQVEAVSNGLTAITRVQMHPPDLVLTDIMMPGLDGFGLLKTLRNDPKTGNIPVILLSARAGEEASAEGFQAGADDYLIKPFSARELLSRIHASLRVAQLHRRVKETAVTDERTRIAHDLHDTITQTLWSASLVAERLPALWSQSIEQGQRSLEILRKLNANALVEIRALLFELYPLALSEAKFSDLIRELADQMSSQIQLGFSVIVKAEYALPSEIQINIYRIVLEAVHNIIRHASATYAKIYLDSSAKRFELQISDNGRGFDVQTTQSGHFGLKNMQDRATSMGATLQITSRKGGGTQLRLVWKPTGGSRTKD